MSQNPAKSADPGAATAQEKGDAGVRVDKLGAVDPDSAGVLDADRGGLGIDMWKGSDRALVERLLARLPVRTRSPVLRDLARRLLLSTATAPSALSASAGAGRGGGLMAIRMDRLAAMSDLLAVERLSRVASPEAENAAMARVQVESLLIRNDNAGACAKVRAVARHQRNAFWQRVLIFCQALASEHDKAALGLDLLRETGTPADDAFVKLVNALAGDSAAVVDSLPEPAPLHLAMMRAARLPLPPDVTFSADPNVLSTIARSPNASLELRLEAAEKAEAMGALAPESLAQIYASIEFTVEELSQAAEGAKADSATAEETTAEEKAPADGPRARGLLYRVAGAQADMAGRARVLRTALHAAARSGHYATVVRVNLPLVVEIAPDSGLIWFAADAARALYAVGRATDAAAWLDLVAGLADHDPAAAVARNALWPLAELLDGAGVRDWTPKMLAAWHAEIAATDLDVADARGALLYGLLEALGEPVPDAAWTAMLREPFLASGILPVPPLWQALRRAAAAKRVGETVLLVLVALGDDGTARAHPMAMAAAVAGLRAVGLTAEARGLALEAALAAGI
ncbi:MAG: hypothetical protein ACTSRY_00330 [Alphaproteobacteria bacterium]